MKKAILLAAALSFSACIHTIEYGRQFDASKVPSLEKGRTSKQEVLTMFGAPESSSLNGDGILTLNYAYIKTTGRIKLASFIPLVGPVVGGTASSNAQKTLTVSLKDGVVTNFVYTQDGVPDAPTKKASQ
jgi:outer membrane protein assembly factor BamE (lipoprotein component of BamABCDE complex)